MTFTLNQQNLYFIICILLLVLQVYQRYEINRMKKHIDILANNVLAVLLYIKGKQDEEGKFHNMVWQTTGCCEDDYSGYLLFPLNNGKYWKISYSC